MILQLATEMRFTLAIVVLTVTLSRCYPAEQELDKRVLSEAIARLSKENKLELQSNLRKQLSLHGSSLSNACSEKMGKLITTEIAQAFPSNFCTFIIAECSLAIAIFIYELILCT